MGYVDDLHLKVTDKLVEARKTDARTKILINQYQAAQKRNDTKRMLRILKECEEHDKCLANQLVQKQLVEDDRNREWIKYMNEKDAQQYNQLRTAINLTTDALETLFIQMSDLIKKCTDDFVNLQFPKEFSDCQKAINKDLKLESQRMTASERDLQANLADEIMEIIKNKAGKYIRLTTTYSK